MKDVDEVVNTTRQLPGAVLAFMRSHLIYVLPAAAACAKGGLIQTNANWPKTKATNNKMLNSFLGILIYIEAYLKQCQQVR